MRGAVAIALLLLLSPLAAAIDNGLARTPPMTWSSPSPLYAHPPQPATALTPPRAPQAGARSAAG